MNPHEAAARLAKTMALVEAIDGLNAKPRVPAADLLTAVRDQDASWWTELARLAEVRPPSETTRLAVLAVLERRVSKGSATGRAAFPPGLPAPSRFSDPVQEALVADTEPMLSAERDFREPEVLS